MIKLFTFFLILASSFVVAPVAFAQSNSFVSIVNPVRGSDFWDNTSQKPLGAFKGQVQILKKFDVSTTFLLRPDAFDDREIIELLKNLHQDEKGIFLEVTPTWTKTAGVKYHESNNWHSARSAFLSGYDRKEREKLVDAAFEKFKKVFGFYPKSVGAWWVDAFSLEYMQKKYGIIASLIVADQYTTDNYQIWGQYWSTPYYPSKNNALHPAQTKEYKLPLVMLQWAARDPINAYGSRVEESTFSVQANDYIDYHRLDTAYFGKLVDIYTQQSFNQFGHLVVGLENSYSFEKYGNEYRKQIEILVDRQKRGQLNIVTMGDFASRYFQLFPDFSAEHIIIANDPLGSSKKVVWFMNPYYRISWFYNQDGSAIRDIRQYIEGEEELCYQKGCEEINFATSAIRVLDEVSFGHKLSLDQGKISDFNVRKSKDKFVINYKNEAGRQRIIEFLPRDISIDGKISSIDTQILEATRHQLDQQKKQIFLQQGHFNWSLQNSIFKIIKFIGFLSLGCLIPGLLLINRTFSKEAAFLQKSTLATILGLILITLLFYMLSFFDLKQVILLYLLMNLFILVKKHKQLFNGLSLKIKDKFNFLLIVLIGLGTIFQQLPTFKNGLNFPYGLGFWGPNTHDGIWHVALINQLIKEVPPQNPIFAEEILQNYHYFYDLLVAATNYISGIPVMDLVFRFFPIAFSLILGISSYYLIRSLFKSKIAAICSLYLIYFSGSFGWIVEYIRLRHLGGESAFWANQSISFNLNPPYASSLLVVIAIFQLLPALTKFNSLSFIVITILTGSLVAFKAYAAVLIIITLLVFAILKRSLLFLLVFITSSVLSSVLFLSNFNFGKQLIIFSPLWFIHSMIDSPDRVGWVRLSLARTTGFEQGNWFKFLAAELISLLIFILGNLGTRFFALFSLIKLKSIFKNTQYLLLFLFSSLSLIIPILFIQAGNPWNTIQFIYYFLYIAAVVGGFVFAKIVVKLPKILTILAVCLFIVVTPINSWATANGYLSYQPHSFITVMEYEALEFLKLQKDGTILTYPYDQKLKDKIAEPWPQLVYDSTAYISAMSSKASFVEDEPQNQILLTDYKKRIVAAKDFFSGRDVMWSDSFLKSNNIRYIYLPKIYNISLDAQNLSVRQIFENDEVKIYQVIN